MGVVYEAYDRELQQLVALKTLRLPDARWLERFKREFRSLHDISHRNLVAMGEFFDGDPEPFFTMELLRGVNFLAHVRGLVADAPGEPISETGVTARLEVVRAGGARAGAVASAAARPMVAVDQGRLRAALRQLVMGLGALHESGKVHRDVKPTNILVTTEGRVVLLDFGLVARASQDPRSTDGVIVGTAAYMAPEQALAGEVTAAADWYSLGVVLFEALTGALPYTGRTPYEIILRKQQGAPPPPSELAAAVPADLDALCTRLLQPRPGDRPALDEILDRLGEGAVPHAMSERRSGGVRAPTRPPFVGRADELGRLFSAYEQARGGPVVALVEGVSGVGKTKLVEEFVAQLHRRDGDVVVLAGRCYEREVVSYKAFDGVAEALARYLERLPPAQVAELLPRRPALLARLFPVLRKVEAIAAAPLVPDVPDPHDQRQRMFAALRELFVRLGERRRLVWFIDDLQWTDADSMVLLQDLLTHEDRPPVLLIVTMRAMDGAPRRTWLDTVTGLAPTERIRLDELPVGDARALAALLLPGRDPTTLAGVVTDAGGHPMLLHELARHADTRGDAGAPAPTLDEMLAERIGRLPGEAQTLLHVVSIYGGPVSHEVAAIASGLSGAEEIMATNVLRAAHLVRTDGVRRSDRIVAYHDRVREHVCARLEASRRARLHERLALALERTGAAEHDPRALVRHARAAGRRALAATYAVAAARHAVAALAFDQAAELLAAAIELGDHDEATLRGLRIDMATALMHAGRGPEAAAIFMAAAEGADPAVRLDCQRQAAEQWIITGHIAQGMSALRASLADIGEPLAPSPRRALARVVVNRARLRLRGTGYVRRVESEVPEVELRRLDVLKAVAHGLAMVDNIRGADFNGRFLLAALRTGEPRRLLAAMATEVVFLASQAGRAGRRARRMYAELERLAGHCPDDAFARTWLLLADGAASFFEGRFVRAVDALTRAEAIFAEGPRGLTYERNNTRVFRVHALRLVGALRLQGAQIAELVRAGRQRGDHYLATTLELLECLPLLARGDVPAARAGIEGAVWSPPDRGFHVQHWNELRSRAELALYDGSGATAFESLATRFAALRRSLLLRVKMVRAEAASLRARLALVAAAAGGDARARGRAEALALVRQLEGERVGYARAYALLVRAGLGALDGRSVRAETVACLREAITTAAALDMGLHLAAARHHLGVILGGDEGAELRAAAAGYAAAEGIVEPERMFAIVAPGVSGPKP
jgi:tetratricopeptide (TPR) repeat protein